MNINFDFTEEGKRIITTEQSALNKLSAHLSTEFSDLCRLLFNLNGSVVISGIGKAGLIGKKISATLASTGTPSYWLDPINALHGDLGMVRSIDIALLLSNSGNSVEILELAKSLKRLNIKVACFTKDKNTALAQISDLAVPIGCHVEACPLRLAPSSSTIAMLSLGDALALAVQKAKGFSEDDYALYHPGGALGRHLMKIKECMRPLDKIAVVQTNTTILETIRRISKAQTGMCVIVDDKLKIKGVFTEGDFRRAWEKRLDIRELPVYDFSTKNCLTIDINMCAKDALRLMSEKQIIALPAIDSENIVHGLVLLRDIC
jgi:arabinose-5-phosphate isomerase